jgi:hypothetical protein
MGKRQRDYRHGFPMVPTMIFKLRILQIVFAGCCASSAIAADLSSAAAAYEQSHIVQARSEYRQISQDNAASPHDRASAVRELAKIAWLIDQDSAGAQALLNSQGARADEPCRTAAQLVRVLRESGKTKQSIDSGARASMSCEFGADALRLQIAAAYLDLARNPAQRADALAHADIVLSELSDSQRKAIQASRLRLELALVAGNPQPAYDAWTAYFWLAQTEAPPALVTEFPPVHKLFQRSVPIAAAPEDQLMLAQLLMRAGFERQLRGFIRARNLANRLTDQRSPQWHSIAQYLVFREDAEKLTRSLYRGIAQGKESSKVYESRMRRLMAKAAARLSGHRLASDDAVAALLEQQWGLHGSIGLTDGFMSLHLGHVIDRQSEHVEQHGRSGDVQRLVLDNMLSNGYEAWLWDGAAQAGGWAEDGARLIQIRPAYVSGIESALEVRPGLAGREKSELKLRETDRGDAQRVHDHGLVDLLGVAAHLRLQVVDQIVADIQVTGHQADDANAFQARYWDGMLQGSITVHEGRHVLDQAEYAGERALSSPELEYRAKLSELQFAIFPKLDLSTMVTGQIGSDSSHGAANTRILQGLERWMDSHRGQIADFHSEIPTVLQIPLLTDAQLRDFGCAEDPACPKAAH